jgi:hypothetical protein
MPSVVMVSATAVQVWVVTTAHERCVSAIAPDMARVATRELAIAKMAGKAVTVNRKHANNSAMHWTEEL